jgi:HD-like signal output (HDOD) protein
MLPSFLRRLFGARRPAPAAGAPVPIVTAASAPVRRASRAISMVDEPRVARVPDAGVPARTPEERLGDELREQLARSLRQLDNGLMEETKRSADVLQLLRTLRDDPGRNIRQLPVAAQRALALVNSDAATNSLVHLLENDPATTQALLQQANGSHYNPTGARVLSLTDAINRIGRTGVKSVLLQQSVAGMVCRPGGELDAMVQQVWNHMVRVGPLARELAPAFGADPEEAFLLGLLHDVGKLVIFDRLSALRAGQRRVLAIDRTVISRTLRLLHEALGGLAALQWGLGEDSARAIGSHHREPVPAMRDACGEVIYVAERLDLARERKETPDLDAIWRRGALSGDRDAVDETVSRARSEHAA